jgi:hypothetical protein
VIVHSIPERAHGRALSLWESVQCACCVAPAAATGALVSLLGLRAVLACCSALAGAVAAASLTALREPSAIGIAGAHPTVPTHPTAPAHPTAPLTLRSSRPR